MGKGAIVRERCNGAEVIPFGNVDFWNSFTGIGSLAKTGKSVVTEFSASYLRRSLAFTPSAAAMRSSVSSVGD